MMTKMTKRALASMLSVVMCVSLVSTSVRAEGLNGGFDAAAVESAVEESSEVKTEEVTTEEVKTEEATTEEATTEEAKTEEAQTEETTIEEKTEEAITDDSWDHVTTEKKYIKDNCEITFILAGYWENGYTARVVVKNTTDKTIHDWCVQLDTEAQIDQIWNADIKIHEDDTYAIKNLGWNQDIRVGESVEFSYSGTTGFEKFPTDISLLNAVNNNKQDYEIEYVIINEAGSSYVANINITNNTDKTLEEWILEFDFNREISGMWNGILESQEGNHYIVRNSGYNGNIAPGETITIGFVGNDDLSGEEPSNYKLISAGELETEEETTGEKIDLNKDSDADGLPDYIEEVLGTDKDNADTDGDGISDYDEVYVTYTDPLVADADADTDGDGLTNAEEIALGTSTVYTDTDEDGLSDYDEVKIYGTDPLKADTDGDGVLDGKEAALGTDPTSFDKTFDVNVYADEEDTVKVGATATLNGNQVDSFEITKVDDEFLFPTNMPGYIGGAYDFSVNGTFDSATITFEFDKELLNDSKFDPVIYYFDEENQELLPLETVVTGNVASTTVPHFSKYILLNRTVYEAAFTWQDVWTANSYSGVEVVLAIDDSGSMTSYDRNYQRLVVANDLVDSLPANSKVGVIKFESKITNLTGALTNDRDSAKSFLTKSYFKSSGGTYMYRAIESSFNLFTSDDESVMRMIVVISDGVSSETSKQTATITAANQKGVKIYTVGLGSSNSSYFKNYLKPLAEKTGAKFYLASDANELHEIFKDIVEKIDIETDSDGDGISDYYEDNMVMFNGVTLKLDKNNPDTDGDGLPDGKEIAEIKYKYNADKTKAIVTGRVIANPLEKDTDYDGVVDSLDPAPLSGKFVGKMTGYYNVNEAEYTMDFRKFFKNATTYSTKLSSTSLMLANTIYEGSEFIYTSGGSGEVASAEAMMAYHGFDAIENYRIKATDDDVSEISLGLREVTYQGVTKKILAVVVRGTNGTIQEWSSNFDMGDPSTWSSDYHKGFYLTEDRLHTYLKNYVTRNVTDTSNLVYWITGHSRGAALGNLMAGRLVDEGKTVVAYTFATPNITIKTNTKDVKYRTIHSIVNKRDVVTYLPASQWGFTTYGNTYVLDLGQENLTSTWTEKTGQAKYNALESNLIDTAIKRIVKSCAGSWDEVFDYAGSQNIDDGQYAMFSDRAKRYAKFTERKSIFGKHKGYKVYPSLALFFQFGAECIGGSDVEKSNVGELMPEFWNSKFAGALLLLIGDVGFNKNVSLPDEFSEALVGDGHAPATYYVLVNGSYLKNLD